MEPLITIKGLNKSYGSEVILSNIEFSINKAEIFVVLGASGAGKTTLLKILSRLETCDTGTVNYTDDMFEKIEVPLPVVFQDFEQLLPWYSVEANILLPYKRKTLTKDDVAIVDFLGLTAHLAKYPHELSGGMIQRAAIARSLLSDGKIIFMDEPFGSLDLQRRMQLQQLIVDINQRFNKAIFFITHDIEEAKFLAHRVGLIKDKSLSIIDKATL